MKRQKAIALEARVRHIAAKYKPKGWTIVERAQKYDAAGMVMNTKHFPKTIYVPPLKDAHALGVALHEFGHVAYRSVDLDQYVSNWLAEYEAEMYAITILRIEGFPVTKEWLEDVAFNLQKNIGEDDDEWYEDHDEWPHCLKLAFGKDWVKW